MSAYILHDDDRFNYYHNERFTYFLMKFINDYYRVTPRIVPLEDVKFLRRADVIYENVEFPNFTPKIEYDVFSLDSDLLSTFLYLTVKFQFLHEPVYADRPELLPSHNYIFKMLHEEFTTPKWQLDVYYYGEFSIPWNPYIVTFLKHLKRKVLCGIDKPEADVNLEVEKYSIFTYYPNLRLVAKDLFNFKFSSLESINLLRLSECNYESLVLTGTACVGKTSLQRKLEEATKVPVFKHTIFGGFKHKDDSQINALMYQVAGFSNLAKNLYISDRGPLDNLIWRIIMHLVGIYDEEKLIDEFMKIMGQMNHFVFNSLSNRPWIVILETDELQNKHRMIMRNEGGDYYRAFLPHYVRLQNMVYGVIGLLCGSSIITNNYMDKAYYALVAFLNVAKINLPVGELKKYEFVHPNEMKNFDTKSYACAKALNIFK